MIYFLLIAFYKIFYLLSTLFYYSLAPRSKRDYRVRRLLNVFNEVAVYQHGVAVYLV